MYLAKYLQGSELTILNAISPDAFVLDESDELSEYVNPSSMPWEENSRGRITNRCKRVKQIYDKVISELNRFSEYLHLTPLQTSIMVVIIELSMDSRHRCCSIDSVSRFFEISDIESLPFKKEVDKLVADGYLKKTFSHGEPLYYTEPLVADAVLNNKPFIQPKPFVFDRYKFCAEVSNFIDMRSNGEIDTFFLTTLVANLEENSQDLEFVKKICNLVPDIFPRILFYEICDDCYRGTNKYSNIRKTCLDIYNRKVDAYNIINLLRSEQHSLVKLELVQVFPAKMIEDAQMTLTDDAKHLFFENDYNCLAVDEQDKFGLIKSKDIKDINLFYDDDFDNRITPLKKVLHEDMFKALQQRLEDHHMPKGVAAIFYGAPGTGKTETVKQLAKATGRSIFQVDISETKSCWVGESEKLVKEIFSKYKSACKREKLKPILLFNEADGVLTKRAPADSQNPEVTQMQNAMQNIILEEMENLDGIMIATTNLHNNLDAAFERRFLYKVEFKKPDVEVKTRIWKDKMPSLSDDDARRLSTAYDFSGGEIDNIVRKCVIEEVVNDVNPTVDKIMEFCSAEKFTSGSRRVGFAC